MQKKSSPLKHVTPILKKYNCQRQAKSGLSVKALSPGKQTDQKYGSPQSSSNVKELVEGMDSLDAALKKAEKCMSGNKGSSDLSTEQPVDLNADDVCDPLQDIEEDGVSTALHGSSHQSSTNARVPQLRNRSRMLKQRNRLQKELEHALPLALSEHPLSMDCQSHAYAVSYFNQVKERLEESSFNEFVVLLDKLRSSTFSVTDLYHRIIDIMKAQPDLSEKFLGFLLPHEALHCGKFMEHLGLMEMHSFLKRLEMYFSKQPQQLRKIFSSLNRLIENSNVTIEAVRSTVLPLLKGNSFLIDSFLELLPTDKPPESKMTDFDTVAYEEIETEQSGDEEGFERIEIPPESDDLYGGEHCHCCCHDSNTDTASANRSKHCVACGLKFISGKMYMQTEHGLRPVRVRFAGGGSNSANVKRLNSDPRKLNRSRSRRGRTTTAQVSVKADDSKTIEADEECFSNKNKSPRSQRSKISKQGGLKSNKSLNVNRNIGNRKPTVSKVTASPLPHPNDQEALPAPGSNVDVKPTSLDFLAFSNVLRLDKDKSETIVSVEKDVKDVELGMEYTLQDDTDVKDSKSTADRPASTSDIAIEDCKDDLVCDVDVDVSGESSEADVDSGEDIDENAWTREEDRIILHTFQAGSDPEETLSKISTQLPNRSKEEINSRFHCLISIIQQMR